MGPARRHSGLRRTSHIQNMDVLLSKFTWVEVSGIRLYSCYLPPSDSIEEFERSLEAIVTSARTSTLPVVIGETFNACTIKWRSKKTVHRGHTLLEAFAMLEREIANIWAMPTYIKGEKSSIIDLTFLDPRLSREGSYWQVSDRYTASDHRALTYQLSKEQELRLGLKASHVPSQRHAML